MIPAGAAAVARDSRGWRACPKCELCSAEGRYLCAALPAVTATPTSGKWGHGASLLTEHSRRPALSSDVERQPDGADRGRTWSSRPPSFLRPSSRRPSSPRRELTLTLLLGAVGAGLVLLSTRQGWAQVQTTPPRPLLASRRLLRRLTGGLFAIIALSLGASAFTLSRATAITAATANISPASSSAASVTDGGGTVSAGTPDVAGTAPHVVFAAAGWQAMVV